jgi:hypothetical protein
MTGTLPAARLNTVSDHLSDAPADPVADEGPVTLRAAVLVLWIEAAGMTLLAIVEGVKLATSRSERPGLAAVMALATLAVAAILVELGRLLVRRKLWARGLGIVLQLMALPVAYFMISGEGGPLTRIGGALIALIALLGAGLLFAPASRLALTRHS